MLRISPVGALGALFLVLLQSAACSEPARITEVEHFESVVLKSADIYLVLFTFESDDPIRGRGVNQEQCRKVEAGMSALIEKLAPLGITVMVADVEDVSAIASEFNVRSTPFRAFEIPHGRTVGLPATAGGSAEAASVNCCLHLILTLLRLTFFAPFSKLILYSVFLSSGPKANASPGAALQDPSKERRRLQGRCAHGSRAGPSPASLGFTAYSQVVVLGF